MLSSRFLTLVSTPVWILSAGLLVLWPTATCVYGQADEHGAHDEHPTDEDEHEDEHDEGSVRLSKSEIEEFGIQLARAGEAVVGPTLKLAGEIVVNPNRFAHVVPRVGGVVRQVFADLGDNVKGGDVMAVIESTDLSDLKSAYLAALERKQLADASLAREERLWKQEITSEREYLSAKQAAAEARIRARSAEDKLRALGFSEAYLERLPELRRASFTEFEISAPFEGTVVSKHITLGESVEAGDDVFSVTDLRTVWAVLAVYQRDLNRFRIGMDISIQDREGGAETFVGKLTYLSPVIDEATRTGSARVVVQNPEGRWRPGMFVRGLLVIERVPVAVAVPANAVQRLDGKPVVFVYDGNTFTTRVVRIGRSSDEQVEIVSGIRAGEVVAAEGAFTLSTQIEKSEFSSGHNH